MTKSFIKNLSLTEVESLFDELGEKPYRAKQLFNWLYEKNIESFSEMTNFTKELRKTLDGIYSLPALNLEERQVSKTDDTEKYLFKTHDSNYIESVLIKNDTNEKERITLCVSSQAGCAMGCRFCQTAQIGFKRNLETAEILDQINQVRRISGLINNNIVFMGMGEPLLNYDNVLKAADIMNYSFGFHISVRRITISTCGITEAIERFIDEKRPYNLAVSVNDTVPERRIKNMPVEKKYPVAGVIDLFEKKFPVSRNRLTIAYVMRKDNISSDDAKRLKKMFRHARIKLNLIALNPGTHMLDAPSQNEMDAFIKELEIMNVPVSVRKSFGTDIDGACGQLSGKHSNKILSL
jgi:23S rRNA (adenine2503-C2)-methyltransferase